MILPLFKNLFKIEFKYFFRGRLSFLFYAIGILVNLVVYFYTSKAFTPNVAVDNVFLSKGYFEFIILGELLLVLMSTSFNDGQNIFLRYRDSGYLLQVRYSKLGIFNFLFFQHLISMLLIIPYIVLTLILSWNFFNLSLKGISLLTLILLFTISVFLFFGIYLINIASLIFFRRKNQFIVQILGFLSFFSGAYFPIEIINNDQLVKMISYSPFTSFVSFSRELIYFHRFSFQNFFIIFVFCLICFLAGYTYLKYIFKKDSLRLYELL